MFGSPSLLSTGLPPSSWSTGTVYVSTVVVAPDVFVASIVERVVAGERARRRRLDEMTSAVRTNGVSWVA